MTSGSRLVSKGVLCFACCACGCMAQSPSTARIAGTVVDLTGAVIVKAEIVARNCNTGEKRIATSDESGEYLLSSLPPGTYEVTISAPGFSPAQYNEIHADVSRTVTLNGLLKVGDATSEIRVSGVPLQTASAEIAIPINAQTLSALPLPTRNFLQLAVLAPGSNMPLSDNSALGRNSPNFSINGARTSQNNLQINGVDANDISAHDFAGVAIPSPETISSVVVKTSMTDASAAGAGGTIELITQTGTNSLHGSAYGFFRDSILNANDPNLKAVGLGRPVLNRSVYGATLGGPIRKDHAFFFATWQDSVEANGATGQSLYSGVLIAPVPPGTLGLTDDRSQSALLENFQPILPSGTRSVDPVALALLNARLPDGQFLIPTPQQDGRVTGTAPSTYSEQQFNLNLNLANGASDSLGAGFFFANAPQFWALGGGTFSPGSGLPGFGTRRYVDNRLLSLEQVHKLGSIGTNEAHFGYNLVGSDEFPQASIQDSTVGISRPNAKTSPGFPLILLARDEGGASIGSSPIIVRGHSSSLSASDLFSLVRGKHTLRLGGGIKSYQWNAHADASSYGEIDFPTFDHFLLGQSDFSTIGIGVPDRDFRTSDYELFVQDDWRLSHGLTVNLGLRYELDMPPYDTKGRIGGFDPALYRPRMAVDSAGVPVGPPAEGIVVAANIAREYSLPDIPTSTRYALKSIDPNNLAPRIGFAWSILHPDRLVFRGGYGIYYSRPSFGYLAMDFFAPPFYATFQSVDQTFANPFPDALPEDRFPVLQPGLPLTGSIMDSNNRTPYFQQFNTGVESRLSAGTSLQVAYVGSRGVRLFRQVAVNQARIASTAHPITNAVTGATITANTPDNAALRAPFQGADTWLFDLNQTSAQATYHSLQTILTRRMAHGLAFQASYTLSKSIDNASNAGGGAFPDATLDRASELDTGVVIGNQFGHHANRGISDFDRTHYFVMNWDWSMPRVSWAGMLLADWQLSGLVIAMSGLPIDLFDPAAGDLYGLLGARPSWVPGASRKTATRDVPRGYSFNPFSFALPAVAPGQAIPSANDPTALAPNGGNDIGNVGRNVLRGPPQSNVDLSVSRRMRVRESSSLELRADFFNALNHPSRSNPISDITVAPAFDPEGHLQDAGDFGRTLTSDSSPRIMQLSLKFAF